MQLAEARQDLVGMKADIARAQLGAALAMFINHQDSVSVHCLACGGGEIIDGLVAHAGRQPLSTSLLVSHPEMNAKDIRATRTQYWNAFKHVTTQGGDLRDDVGLISRFTDERNDGALFLGWWDYQLLRGRLPIAAQVFQVWYYALYESALSPHAEMAPIRHVFPDIATQPRLEQKRRLKHVAEAYERDAALLSDPLTDPRPLILSATA